ncbi:MAG: holo-ACP synthase [Sphaerochaetaceae bacterium]|nr:holo-ACP synthase [Sphaerochaetaceae bacterium]
MIFGIGVDAVECERMNEKRMTFHIINRLFHKKEVEQMPVEQEARKVYLASRFAAKEAFVKAVGEGFRFCAPRQICVTSDLKGKPVFLFDDEVTDRMPENITGIHLSITHEGPLAVAFVVLEVSDGEH